jgi:Fe-S-cluster containining protein
MAYTVLRFVNQRLRKARFLFPLESMSQVAPHPDQPLEFAVAQAYAQFDARAALWIEDFTRDGGTVFCKAGCFHCCNLPIQVSLAEALLLASSLSDAQSNAMRARAFEVIENAKSASSWDKYFQSHRERVGFCPLLDANTGMCTAYAVRPGRCRDTLSAMSSRYCQVGTLEQMNRRERTEYDREVAALEVTDGESHYIQPLEDMGESIWKVSSRAMRKAWGLEVWGDFWVLTALATDAAFMLAVRGGRGKAAVKRAKALGLWHFEIVRIEVP